MVGIGRREWFLFLMPFTRCKNTMRHRQLVAMPLVLALSTTASGCCTALRFFCGPDRSEWVTIDYASPRKSLDTVMEAIRRANGDVLWESMTETLKQQLGIPGRLEASLVIDRVREEVPGFHLIGTAGIEALDPATDARGQPIVQEFILSVAGQTLRLGFRRIGYWEAAWIDSKGRRRSDGAFVDRAAARRMFRTEASGYPGAWDLEVTGRPPRAVVSEDLAAAPNRDAFEHLEFGFEWRLDTLVANSPEENAAHGSADS